MFAHVYMFAHVHKQTYIHTYTQHTVLVSLNYEEISDMGYNMDKIENTMLGRRVQFQREVWFHLQVAPT